MKLFSFIILNTLFFYPLIGFGQEFTSTSFEVADPVIQPASFGTSSNFQLYGVLAQPSIGESAATNFSLKAGFLYFPLATSPTLSASPGDSTVSLSWSASTGFLGWTISSYSIGYSSSAGGPYNYSSVGNVTSSSVGSLSNGTTYYFVVRAKDYFGNFVATSSEVSATPAESASGSSGGGGALGGGPIIGFIPTFNKPQEEIKECRRTADLNCDGYVDIIDFSIMYYWFERQNPPQRVDLRADGRIDIYDFSVMAYYWYEKN